jgi:hypothetical protein
MMMPTSGQALDTKLSIDHYAGCRHPAPASYVYYYGLISNLGTAAAFGQLQMVWFPEFQTDWET